MVSARSASKPITVARARSIHSVERLLERHYRTATMLIAGFVFVNFVVQRTWSWDAGFFGFELLFAFLTIGLPIVIVLIVRWARSLSSPIGDIAAVGDGSESAWLDEQLDELLLGWGPLACGAGLLIVGVYSTATFWVPWDGWIGTLFYIWAGVFFFGYGTLAWGFGSLLVLVWRISNLPIRCSPFRWPINKVDAVYRVYFRILSLGAVLYGAAVLSVWISPGGARIALQTSLGMLWVFPPAACVILFFLTFHFRIHKLLLRYKQASADELTMLLDAEYGDWIREPSSERADRIDKLLNWHDHVRKADEWPMGLRAVLLTITTLLLPTIKTVIEFVTK